MRKVVVGLALAGTVLTGAALAGCASSPQQPANPGAGSQQHTSTPGPSATAQANSTPAATPPSPSPVDVTVTSAVTDGTVSRPPRRVEVDRGQRVRLVVTSDRPDKVHVHGYNLEEPVGPGNRAVITFTADQAGVFEVETHKQPAKVLVQLEVR